jgi:hypothetical protein
MKLNGNSCLPEPGREEMRQLREAKPWLWSYGSLAEHFGCSRWTAMNICKQSKTKEEAWHEGAQRIN